MKVPSPKELGIFVRERRREHGWTQLELASRVGVQPLWISQFERGKATAQIGLVMRTLKALNAALSVGDAVPSGGGGIATVVDLDSLVQPNAEEIIIEPDETMEQAIRRTMKEEKNTGAANGKASES